MYYMCINKNLVHKFGDQTKISGNISVRARSFPWWLVLRSLV